MSVTHNTVQEIYQKVAANDRELQRLSSADNEVRAVIVRESLQLKDAYRRVTGKPWRDW